MARLSLILALAAATASAQEFLNPNVGGCGMGTDKTVVDRSVGGRSIRLPADGTVGTITFADDAIADGTLDAEVTGSCRQEGNKVTVFAKGRVVNRAAFASNTQASVGFSLNMRPHAKPFNTDYLLRAAGNFSVTWDRGNPGALGGASAGFSMTNCDPGGNKSFGAAAGPAAQGVAVNSATVECRRRSGDPFGFLESDVPISLSASVHQFAGAPQEFSFEGTVVFELLRVGKEIRVVTGPTVGLAGTPFPEPFVVSVANNGNGAPASGEPVRFRLLRQGTEVAVVDAATGADGKATAGFTPPAGGSCVVEAVCAGCPASSQELGQGSKAAFPAVTVLSGELSALPGPREGPLGGSIELAFKATEKTLVGGVAQEALIVGTPVGFTVSGPAGDAAFGPNPATTGPDGVARTTITLGSAPGTYSVTANCAACQANQTVRLDIEAKESAFALVKDTDTDPTAGDGQKSFIGRVLPLRLRIKLQSGGRDSVQGGAPIQFIVTSPPESIGARSSPDVTATESGRASTILRLGNAPGEYQVKAVCEVCTAGREVVFTEFAKPVPTLVAGFMSDSIEGPSVAFDPDQSLNVVFPKIGLNVNTTVTPKTLLTRWEIVEGGDKVEFLRPPVGPQAVIGPVAPSFFPGDVVIKVIHGPDFAGRTASKPLALTVQQATRIVWSKGKIHDCAQYFDKNTRRVLPGVMSGTGRNGVLVDFAGAVLDQFRAPLDIPADSTLEARERGKIISVENPLAGLPALGNEFDIGLVVQPKGRLPDQIGHCAAVPYPPGYSALADRCVFVSGRRIQREHALSDGRDAAITISNDPGCVPIK